MPAHYLLTFIGTGGYRQADGARAYREADYELDGERYRTTLLAHALFYHGGFSGVIVAGTVASMWEKVYEHFAADGPGVDEDIYLALGTRTEAADAHTPVDDDLDEFGEAGWLEPVREALPGYSAAVLLEYGLDSAQLARNVERIATGLAAVPAGGELAVDITHGFRSFPLVALAALQALSVQRDRRYRVGAVYYGMLDAASALGYAPVVRLDLVTDLEYAGRAAYIAQAYGRFDELLPVLPEGELAEATAALNDAIALQRLGRVGHLLARVAASLGRLDGVALTVTERQASEALRWVLRSLFAGFGESPTASQQQYVLARWFHRQRNYAAAYLLLAESVVTERCLRTGGGHVGKAGRQAASAWLGGAGGGVRAAYRRITRVRHRIAHASLLDEGADDLAGEIDQLPALLAAVRAYVAHSIAYPA